MDAAVVLLFFSFITSAMVQTLIPLILTVCPLAFGSDNGQLPLPFTLYSLKTRLIYLMEYLLLLKAYSYV
jgi:hypothetical protein